MKIFLAIILFLTVGLQICYSNLGEGAGSYVMTITGPTTGVIGQTTNYTISWTQNGSSVSPPPQVGYYWNTALGNFTTQSSTGASITWTTTGSGVISFDYESWDNYYH